MKNEGILTDEEFAKMDDEAKQISQDSWDFADASPEPSPEELFTHILAGEEGTGTVSTYDLVEAGR
jgi:TPP-dependent pyruvate/acetoin dehydrogenase alpha subunit